MTTMQLFILALAFLAVIGAVIQAARAGDKLDAHLRAMPEHELIEEDFWESHCGHYPNIYSRELDRREAARQESQQEGAA